MKTIKEVFGKSIDDGIIPTLRREVQTPHRASDKLRDHIANLKSNPKNQPLANGSFAFLHKVDDPHEQDYVVRSADHTDAGTMWLEYIYNNPQLHNNPFLPKVKKVEKSNPNIPSFHIEQLYSIHIFDDDDEKAVQRSLISRYFNIEKLDPTIFSMYSFGTIVADILDSSLVDQTYIKDPQLSKALQAVYNCKTFIEKQHPGVTVKRDFHDANIMWRLTPHGPQLVITDPIWIKPLGESFKQFLASKYR